MSRIVFSRGVGKRRDLYVVDYDGQGLRRITTTSTINLSPSWTPALSRIAYVSYAGGDADIYVADLRRPQDADAARRLVREYAADEPEILQRDFYNSLLAAFTPAEVEAQLAAAGLAGLSVEVISDRHLLVHGTR